MINKTALQNPAFLARIRAAAIQAVRLAHIERKPVGVAMVYNRNGAPSIRAAWHMAAKQLEFFDCSDRDVTDAVLQALRAQHKTRVLHYLALAERASRQALPLVTVEYDSGPLEGLPLHIRPRFELVRGAA